MNKDDDHRSTDKIDNRESKLTLKKSINTGDKTPMIKVFSFEGPDDI